MLHFHRRWLKQCRRRRGESYIVQFISDRDLWRGPSTMMWSEIRLSFIRGPVILFPALKTDWTYVGWDSTVNVVHLYWSFGLVFRAFINHRICSMYKRYIGNTRCLLSFLISAKNMWCIVDESIRKKDFRYLLCLEICLKWLSDIHY